MLSHPIVKRNVIILHPATKRMEQKKWILVTFFDKLFSCVFQQKTVTVMERVSYLKCINGISTSFLCNLTYLSWSHTILIHAIIKLDFASESHWWTWNQIITLLPYTPNFWMILRMSSKSLGTNFFLSIIENLWLFNNCHYLILPCERNSIMSFKLLFLLCSDMLSNWNWKNMSLTIFISDCIHIHTLNQFLFIHKSFKRESPSFSNCLQIIQLFLAESNSWERCSCRWFWSWKWVDQGLSNSSLVCWREISLLHAYCISSEWWRNHFLRSVI